MEISTTALNEMRNTLYFEFQGVVLVDGTGTEVSDVIPTHQSGTDFYPTYEWDNNTTDGRIQLAQDIPFDIAVGEEVAGWRAKSGTYESMGDYWTWDTGFVLGADFNTAVTFSDAGTFTLEGTPTYIDIALAT